MLYVTTPRTKSALLIFKSVLYLRSSETSSYFLLSRNQTANEGKVWRVEVIF